MLKNKSLWQFIKFGMVGVSNTLVSQVIYMICTAVLGTDYYILASVIAFIISVFHAFYWQNRFVFKEEENAQKRVWWQVLLKTYCAYAFTGLFLNNVLLVVWIDVVHIENFTPPLTELANSLGVRLTNRELAVDVAPLLNIVVNVPLNFFINKFWAYRQKKSPGIILAKPSEEYAGEVMAYRAEMLQSGDSFDGCAGLEETDTFEEWLDFEGRLRAKYGESYVPSEVFLAVRREDSRLVGIIDLRRPLSEFLYKFGGNIGYSTRPSERRKGYANEMLRLLLDICREQGEEKMLVCCGRENEASRRTILRNGGVLENEVADEAGLTDSGIIQRYWITL